MDRGYFIFCAIVLAYLFFLYDKQTRVHTSPRVDKSIPYCWAPHYGFYLPCVYSDRERNA